MTALVIALMAVAWLFVILLGLALARAAAHGDLLADVHRLPSGSMRWRLSVRPTLAKRRSSPPPFRKRPRSVTGIRERHS
jgi:hypothetical protein